MAAIGVIAGRPVPPLAGRAAAAAAPAAVGCSCWSRRRQLDSYRGLSGWSACWWPAVVGAPRCRPISATGFDAAAAAAGATWPPAGGSGIRPGRPPPRRPAERLAHQARWTFALQTFGRAGLQQQPNETRRRLASGDVAASLDPPARDLRGPRGARAVKWLPADGPRRPGRPCPLISRRRKGRSGPSTRCACPGTTCRPALGDDHIRGQHPNSQPVRPPDGRLNEAACSAGRPPRNRFRPCAS